jgi:hypothetical protein
MRSAFMREILLLAAGTLRSPMPWSTEDIEAHVGELVESRAWHGHLARGERPRHGLEARATPDAPHEPASIVCAFTSSAAPGFRG